MRGRPLRPGAGLTWGNFFLGNLVPVTLGNIVGGALFVGSVYWLVYVRKMARKASDPGCRGRAYCGKAVEAAGQAEGAGRSGALSPTAQWE